MRFNVSELAKRVCYAAALCAVSVSANAALSLEKQRQVYEQAQDLLDKNDIDGYLSIRSKSPVIHSPLMWIIGCF